MSADPPGLRERKKQRTRRAIQRAALQLFARQGYRDTTIAQIAEAADVSLRTVTVHFPAKEDLFLALGTEGFDEMLERVRSRPDGETTQTAMRAMITDQIAEASRHEDSASDLLELRRALIETDPELQARVRGTDAKLEHLLTIEVAKDLETSPTALTPRLAAATMVAGLRMLTDDADVTTDRPDEDDVLTVVDRIFVFATAGVAALDASAEAEALR